MTDTPEVIALRWETGAAVANGVLMDHPDYQRWVREDIAAARIAAAYEAAADACNDYPRVAPDYDEWTRYDEQIAYSQDCIRALAAADPDGQAALARIKAEAKSEGMREAAGICKGVRKGAETDYYGIGALDCAIAILAAADKVVET